VEYELPEGTTGKAMTTVLQHPGDIPNGTLSAIKEDLVSREAGGCTREGVAPVTYRVHVTREDGQWLADVPELEGTHTYAASLTALDRRVREAIVLGADLPDEAVADLELFYSYDLADQLIVEANQLRAERQELTRRELQLQQATERLAILLTKRGYSARDAGPLLGISHQRISQIRPAVAVSATVDKSNRTGLGKASNHKAVDR
jgi:predicted RNase H-like HicB family nuclease